MRASPPVRPPVRLKDIQVLENPALDDDKGVKEGCGEIAVVCNTATSLPCSTSTLQCQQTNKETNKEQTMNQCQGIKQVGTVTLC